VLVSVTAVLLFGEILPQAVCTGPSQLRIAAASVCLVRILLVVTFPVAWPIARLLDCILGSHGSEDVPMYRRRHLKALVRLHAADGEHTIGEEPRESGGLSPEEGLPPLLCKSAQLTAQLLQELSQQPSDVALVHADGNTSRVLGLLPLRRLLALPDSCAGLRVLDILPQPSSSSSGGAPAVGMAMERHITLLPPCRVSSDASLYHVLVSLRACKTSVALVEQVGHEVGPPQVRGVLYLQTVLDELVLSEAVDSSFRRLPTLSFLPRTISGHLGGPRVQRFTLPSRRELLGDTGSLLDSTARPPTWPQRHTDPASLPQQSAQRHTDPASLPQQSA